jgi:predicted nucleotide-binding protein
MSLSSFDREILKYEKKGFKVNQKRTLKHGLRIFLTKERQGFLSSGYYGIYIYYVDDDCTVESMRECFKDYVKFYNRNDFDEEDKGVFLCRGMLDAKLFRDLRKVMIEDSGVRSSIKPKALEEPSKSKNAKEKAVSKVFIVHGRSETPALRLARFLEKRHSINVILLEEQAHRGRTLIEKLEAHSDVDFAFITLTPDDVGALKGERLRDRGRQNVIFEWGQFIGKIGRNNVCLLIKGDVEIPSDLRGIAHYAFSKNIKEVFIDVENELRDAKLL